MANYKIAVATSDGTNVDISFRDASEFTVIEVDENGEYKVSEIREWKSENNVPRSGGSCDKHGEGTGCGGEAGLKPELLSDCRAVICTQIGNRASKEFTSRAISYFEVSGPIEDVLSKIIPYYRRIDDKFKPTGRANI